MNIGRVRLLLVEDNPGDARLIRELLRQAAPFEFDLTHLDDLPDSVRPDDVDALLLDLDLPRSTGLDTVLNALEAAPDVPIIVLSGLADERTALLAVQAGAQDYLAKGEITGRLLAHSVRYAIERNRLEQERLSLLRSEQRARAIAEDAVRARDEVLAIVAHDLRNPLAAINTTVQLVLDGAMPGEQYPHQLEVVLRSTEHMDRLIGDLLDVARLESGAMPVTLQRTPVERLIRKAGELLAGKALEAGLMLRIAVDPAVPDVLADPQRILQCLSNLVGNALRFSPRGGVVSLQARRFGDAVLISVADTGVGIPASDLTHLFEHSWQARHARRGGSGWGLTITKGIVDVHGGRIWAASEEGRGSTFYFTLPIAGADETAALPVETPVTDPRPPEPAAELRVVLVDDHPAIRHGLVELLRARPNLEVLGECGTGEEALDLAERLRPDIVVMDLAMPGIGGLEAARRITSSMPEVRVLALSGESEEEALLPVLRCGASGFVRKSTAHEDLVAALEVVARDEVFLYPTGNRILLESFLSDPTDDDSAQVPLSQQENEILLLAAEGFTSAEIGKKLFLSPKTVDTYRSRLMRRLGLTHRSDLVRFALRTGLLRQE
jgi:DNA-binding NarL/FixJ family response regulator